MTVTQSKYAIVKNELYETPPWVTRALIRHFPLVGYEGVWEPAAGNHAMADELLEHTLVTTSDIETYDRQHDFEHDFLSAPVTGPVPAIITNPPYGRHGKTATRFVEHALSLCDGLVAMLLQAKWDSGSTRLHLTRDNPRFAGKIVLVDRIQWFEGPHTSSEDHAWFVWTDARSTPQPALYYGGKFS